MKIALAADAQWELIEPLVPTPQAGGRPAMHSRRRIVGWTVKCLLGAQIDA
jgi:transposase